MLLLLWMNPLMLDMQVIVWLLVLGVQRLDYLHIKRSARLVAALTSGSRGACLGSTGATPGPGSRDAGAVMPDPRCHWTQSVAGNVMIADCVVL